MIGYIISVYRQADGGVSPATAKSPAGTRIAVWQSVGFDGLVWLDELAKANKAIDLGGDGYPCRYTAIAHHIIPRISDGPPRANKFWTIGGEDYTIGEKWEGKTVVDSDVAAQCRFGEWLLIEAWDES